MVYFSWDMVLRTSLATTLDDQTQFSSSKVNTCSWETFWQPTNWSLLRKVSVHSSQGEGVMRGELQ